MRWDLWVLLLMLGAGPVYAQEWAQEWNVEIGLGGAHNHPLPLTITQSGERPLRVRARFESRSLDPPLYYMVRLERARRGGAVGVEFIHHKLFLANPPPEVEHFEVTHGFNVITLQRAWSAGSHARYRAGGGVLLSHPETVIRGRRAPSARGRFQGYRITGPAVQLAAGLSKTLGGNTRAGLEIKLLGAHARLPIAGGSAELWHASGHLLGTLSQGF